MADARLFIGHPYVLSGTRLRQITMLLLFFLQLQQLLRRDRRIGLCAVGNFLQRGNREPDEKYVPHDGDIFVL